MHVNIIYPANSCLQALLQAAVSEKEEWQQKAIRFEDACETLRVLSRSALQDT